MGRLEYCITFHRTHSTGEAAIMIDPTQVIEAFGKKTSSLLVPTHTHSPSPTALPTVIPNVPIYEKVGETGTKTLWVVFVLMFISTPAFYYLAFRVPVQKRLFHVITALITTIASISYFAMATGDGNSFAHIVIVYQLVVPGRRAVAAKSNSTAKLFASIGGFTLILWTLYPVVWGIGDGARKWSVDAEIIAYAVLDVLAKPVFGFWLLFAHAKNASAIDGFWAHGLNNEGSLRVGDDDE